MPATSPHRTPVRRSPGIAGRGPLRRLALAAAAAAAACSGSEEPELRISNILILPQQVSFDAVGDTRRLSATVQDGDGIAIPDAQVEWSSSDPTVADVSITGVVTSVGGGATTVVASYEGAQASVPVAVEQEIVEAVIIGGNGQRGVVGEELGAPLVLQVSDRLQAGVRGVPVAFEVSEGAGSLDVAEATTDAQGRAQVRWTLGETAGGGLSVIATIDGGTTLTFEAVADAGPAAAIEVENGADQVGTPGQRLGRPIQLRLTDAFGNPVRNAIDIEVVSGGGSVSDTPLVTDINGRDRFTWTLGPSTGPQELAATSGPVEARVAATAVSAAGSAAAVVPVVAGTVSAPARSALSPVQVQVVDAQGVGVEGVSVAFSASEGELEATGDVTDASGVAGTSWLLGPTVGGQQFTATVEGLPPLVLEVETLEPLPGCFPDPVDAADFNLELCFLTEMPDDIRAAFETAEARWEEIITGDLGDIEVDYRGFECVANGLPIQGTLDDVIIYVTVEEIDGPGSVLGSAGPCEIRSADLLPVLGTMRFDVADLENMVTEGILEDVIVHEMGHVLGIGTLWGVLDFLENPSNGEAPFPDTHFTGPLSIAAFDAAGGAERTSGAKVPVENQYGPGTRNGHWRESTMNQELMTGFIDAGRQNPLSAITVASLADLGYTVDPTPADDYTVAAPNSAPGLHAHDRIELVGDILRLPTRVVDARGRVVRIIPPVRH